VVVERSGSEDELGAAGGVSVVDALRAAILRGEFSPQQRLIEAELCARLGGSRFVVRTALQTLASEGLVEMQRNRGARVRGISIDEAIEITEVRLVVEGLLAARAAERATSSDVAELRGLIEEMRAAVDAAELIRYSNENVLLHASIRRIAGQQVATELIERLRAQMVRHQFTLALLPGRPAVSLVEHERIVEAIASGDPELAEATMRAHVGSVIGSLRSLPSWLRASRTAPAPDV
jgi:DNA-binding GntR family transcriptional regulator